MIMEYHQRKPQDIKTQPTGEAKKKKQYTFWQASYNWEGIQIAHEWLCRWMPVENVFFAGLKKLMQLHVQGKKLLIKEEEAIVLKLGRASMLHPTHASHFKIRSHVGRNRGMQFLIHGPLYSVDLQAKSNPQHEGRLGFVCSVYSNPQRP